MNKRWNTVSWVLILIAQVAVGYGIVFLGTVYINQPETKTLQQFLIIPLTIWLGYLVGVYGIGMLGLSLKKVEPRVSWLRLFTTAVAGLVPVLILIFNAATVGVENQQQFHDLVIVRMVPYYTQLCAVFALLGFYITIWWHRAVPSKAGLTKTEPKKKSKKS